LPAATAARLEQLLAAFPAAYQPQRMKGSQHLSEFRQHFSPLASNRTGGEFDPASVARLLCGAELGPHDTFVDVGSGRGKLVVVAAAATDVGAAWGVELSPSRAEEALRAADRLFEMGALSRAERNKVRLLQGNCADSLPEEALGASHFLLALKVPRLRGGRGTQVDALLERLRAAPSPAGRPRILWSVGRRLPTKGDLAFVRTTALDVVSERQWRTDIAVHEYQLR